MTSVNRMVPPSTDIREVYNNSSDTDQELVLNLALFLSNFLSGQCCRRLCIIGAEAALVTLTAHLKLLENDQNKDVLLNAHLYLVKISQVEEREVFKVCLLP